MAFSDEDIADHFADVGGQAFDRTDVYAERDAASTRTLRHRNRMTVVWSAHAAAIRNKGPRGRHYDKVERLRPKILRAFRDGESVSQICRKTGLSSSTIWLLRREFASEGHQRIGARGPYKPKTTETKLRILERRIARHRHILTALEATAQTLAAGG